VRTLFAKFLLWFWLALAVMLGAEMALETSSLEAGLRMHPEKASGPFVFYAGLARETLERGGMPGLDSLLTRFEGGGTLQTFCLDRAGLETRGRPLPRVAREAGLAALRSGGGMLTESPQGFFIGYPLGRHGGVEIALVLHPTRPRPGSSAGEPPGPQRDGPRWAPFLPEDLGVRAVAMLVLGGLGCYLLARYITAPVTRLRQATRRLAEGDLSARVGSEGRRRRDELADLGRDFDRMAARIEALVSAQQRLIVDISHELRSPLARMNVALGLLRQRSGDNAQGMIARLETEADRLNRLIGDLLTLSRAEAGDLAPDSGPVDLGELAAGIAEDAHFEAAARRCEVRLARRDRVMVTGVPALLRSAIENVVRNAVRHTPEGTAVEIAIERRAGKGAPEAVVEVCDHGPGLPEDQLERIFEPFYRAEDARERDSGGTGLGLAIARRAVLQHGGSIGAAKAAGGGLVVTIRLPARGPQA
jgi:two-component system sensor histidine kinase CpxA